MKAARRWFALFSFPLLAALFPAVFDASADIQPIGAEIRANSDDTFQQKRPISVYHLNGSFTAIWENDQLGIRARKFNAAGVPLGPDVALVANQRLTTIPAVGPVVYHSQPSAVIAPGGGYLLIWSRENAILHLAPFQEWREVESRTIMAQRFNSNSQAVGPAVEVSAQSELWHTRPSVVRHRNQVLVAWESEEPSADASIYAGLLARRIDLRGNPINTTQRLDDVDGAIASRAALAVNGEGRFFVAWESTHDGEKDVRARLLAPSGAPRGPSFFVNTTTEGAQRRPAVTSNQANRFLIVWQGRFESPLNARIYSQLIDRNGGKIGGENQISSGEQGGNAQLSPAVARTPGGGFVAIWLDYEQNFPLGVYSVELDAAGQVVGPEMKLNTKQANAQFQCAIAGNDAGEFLGTWEGFLGNEIGVAMRRFNLGNTEPDRSQGLTSD